MTKMTPFLFVYGTLLRTFESSMTRFLKENGKFVSEGRVAGRLYDLGTYPGLILDDRSKMMIKGEIIELRDPQQVLLILDQYEGFDPNHPGQGEYRRALISVKAGSHHFECWSYLYNRDTGQLKPILFEYYADYVKQNPDHQNFINTV